MTATQASRQATWALAVFATVLLVQLPLLLNPGYFSHDELQWAAFADVAPGQAFRWVSWTAIDAFQYRPLTFNLWLWLSQHLFAQPQAFHAVILVWGALNAVLLQRLLRGFDVTDRLAAFGALLFALGPYAAFVHGWVGTLGDLIWVSCALLIALAGVQLASARRRDAWATAGIAFALTVIALLAKEATISIPALATVAWLFDRDRRRNWTVILVASAIPVAVYLALRLDVLLFSAPQGNAYDWSLAHLPRRWLEYQLYAVNVSVFEVLNTLSRGVLQTRNLVAGLLWLAVLAALSRVGWRWTIAFVIGGLAALGPVLVLGASFNQYGYGYAVFYAGILAAAWTRVPRWGCLAIALTAILTAWHGINVMRQIREVGEIQAVFSPAVATLVGNTYATRHPVRLAAPGSDAWIFARLSHQIPSYHGVPIGERIELVGAGEPADYLIQADGRLTPTR